MRHGYVMVALMTPQMPVAKVTMAVRVRVTAYRTVAGMRVTACVVTDTASVRWHGADIILTGELAKPQGGQGLHG